MFASLTLVLATLISSCPGVFGSFRPSYGSLPSVQPRVAVDLPDLPSPSDLPTLPRPLDTLCQGVVASTLPVPIRRCVVAMMARQHVQDQVQPESLSRHRQLTSHR
jgi:hypothetical protein